MRSPRGARPTLDRVGFAVIALVLLLAAGDLVLLPLMGLHAATAAALLGLAAACVLVARDGRDSPERCDRRERRERRGSRDTTATRGGRSAAGVTMPPRDPVALALGVFVVVLLAWLPLALTRAIDPVEGRAEVAGLVTGTAILLGFVVLTRGRPRGLAAAPWGWAAGLALSVLVAGVELCTHRHLWIPAGMSWAETSRTIVAGAFRNPNDFAVVLVAMISGTLGCLADVPDHRRRVRLGLGALLVAGCVVVLLTESRTGLLTLLVVLTLHARIAWRHRRPDASLTRGDRRARTARRGAPSPPASARSARVARPAVAGLAAAAIVAAWTVPALVARNPVAHVLASLREPGTRRSDTLRIDLLRAAFRYVGDSDGLGTGAATFEPLLAADPDPGVAVRTWLHNSFVELLLQYGAVVASALALLLGACLTALVRSRHARPGRDGSVARAELVGALVSFVALGCVAGSCLATPVWWLMLGQAVACASALRRADVPRVAGDPPPRRDPVRAGASPLPARPGAAAVPVLTPRVADRPLPQRTRSTV